MKVSERPEVKVEFSKRMDLAEYATLSQLRANDPT
jgi:hypothetical protein